MSKIIDAIKANPVRLYAVAAAALAIVAFYLPNVPSELFLGLVAAVLGLGGEVTRALVTPEAKAKTREVAAAIKAAEAPTV